MHSAYVKQDNIHILKQALELELFPLKDSYVAFFKRFPDSIEKNPQTVNRLAGAMYELGWDNFLKYITEPKESNRQMGSKFKEWLDKKPLGIKPVSMEEFISNENNAILNASDKENMSFAKIKCGYQRNKGLDFVC